MGWQEFRKTGKVKGDKKQDNKDKDKQETKDKDDKNKDKKKEDKNEENLGANHKVTLSSSSSSGSVF